MYPALPVTGFQLNEVVTGTLVAPFAGETRVGAGSAGAVVNDHIADGVSALLLFGSRLATFQ